MASKRTARARARQSATLGRARGTRRAAGAMAERRAPTGQALGVKRGITSSPPKVTRRKLALPTPPKAAGGGGVDIGKWLDSVLPSRGKSGVVPSTMKKLPKGGVMGYLKNR